MSNLTGRVVWLDVTALDACDPRRPTGIPRTLLNLFHAFIEDGYQPLRFCRIDARRRCFAEVPFDEILARVSLQPRRAPAPVAVVQLSAMAERLRDYYRQTVPYAVRAAMCHVRALVHQLALVRRRLWRLVSRPAAAPLYSPVSLQRSDILLSLGASWVFPGCAALARDLSEQVGFPVVTLIYDLIPVFHPHYFRGTMPRQFNEDFLTLLRPGSLLLAISRHTRADVLRYAERLGVEPPPVEVVRLSESIPAPAREAPPPEWPADGRPFVLCVGTVEVRKNHHLLYHVWRRLVRRHGPAAPRLVLVGGPGWLTGDLLHLFDHDPLLADHVVRLPGCGDAALHWLYRHCLFTVYPSHYEGWGLPVAESLAMGKYCLASNTSSLPEIAPDLAGLLDPDDVPAWEARIEELLAPGALALLEEAVRRRYAPTSWGDTARQIVGHLERHFGPALSAPPALRRSA